MLAQALVQLVEAYQANGEWDRPSRRGATGSTRYTSRRTAT